MPDSHESCSPTARRLELSLTTADGVSLAGCLRAVDAPRGAVVVAHGMSASMDNGAVATTADAMEQAGFAVVTYDARGHGRSAGTCPDSSARGNSRQESRLGD